MELGGAGYQGWLDRDNRDSLYNIKFYEVEGCCVGIELQAIHLRSSEEECGAASIIAHMFTGQREWFRLFCGIAFFTIPSSLSNLVVAIAAAQSNGEQNGAATSGNGPANSGQTNAGQASGGETLSSTEVSSLPLNTRDFSKLLLLAAGTMTDTAGES